LCFSSEGEFRLGFTGGDMILPSGIVIDESCQIWISDAGSDRLLRFDPELCQE
jgi:streptogramin lyase